MNKLWKKPILFLFLGIFSLLIVGCSKKTTINVDSRNKYMNDYYNRLSSHKKSDSPLLYEGIELDLDNLFFDDFMDGVNKDNWYIANQAWGSGGNGGVIKENVGYTDDGILVLKGNGKYYTEGKVKGVGSYKDGSLTGAALISKFTTRPGRYQIKMKVLPRLGACTAFWVYSYDQSNGNNHEIDIELPGGANSTHVISFENVLNTNYITVQMRESQDTKLTELEGMDENFVALNDGNWHTFGFDWYTDPELVVYYIDGVVTAVSNVFVPFADTRLWLGLWFPNTSGFVGEALFESDAMYVDWVEYIPFKNQPCDTLETTFGKDQVAADDEYPTTPISIETPNKVSNATFEYAKTHSDYENYGWDFNKRNLTSDETAYLKNKYKEEYLSNNPDATDEEINNYINEKLKEIRKTTSLNNLTRILPNSGMNDSYGIEVKDIGRIRQVIDSIYDGYNIDFSFYAKGKGKVTIQFQNNIDSKISEIVFDIDELDYKNFKYQGIAPEGTKKIMIMVDTTLNNVVYADDFSMYINR